MVSDELKAAIVLFSSMLDERQRRLYAGLESLKLGYGVGISGLPRLSDIDKVLKFIRTPKRNPASPSMPLIPEHYDTGIKITDAEMRRLNLVPNGVLGRWNYTVRPSQNVN